MCDFFSLHFFFLNWFSLRYDTTIKTKKCLYLHSSNPVKEAGWMYASMWEITQFTKAVVPQTNFLVKSVIEW